MALNGYAGSDQICLLPSKPDVPSRYRDGSLLSRSRHRPNRNPAAQHPRVCYFFRPKAREQEQ